MALKPIIYIEDDLDDLALFLRLLERNRVLNPPFTWATGTELLDYLFGHGKFAPIGPQDLPLFILLDIGLPDQSGLEVLAKIRRGKRTQDVPVVMVTGQREGSDMLAAASRNLEAQAFMTKPITWPGLVEVLRALGLGLEIAPDTREAV